MVMHVAVIGCGNIGTKRIAAMTGDPRADIQALVDVNPDRLQVIREQFAYPVYQDYRRVLSDKQVEAVVISVPPLAAYRIVADCLGAKKHVLCEKPIGRSVAEARQLTKISHDYGMVLKCGFNLRHDAGLNQAFTWYRSGRIGELYFFKCTYVNGAVRSNTNQVGSLLDMGTHVIDLARWFMGEIAAVSGSLKQFEYAVEDLDDNGFAHLHAGKAEGSIHFSFVRWMNAFSLEITGSLGTIEVQNLPKWGTQTVTYHRRVMPSGVPEIEQMTFKGDQSWKNEWDEFYRCVSERDMKWNLDGLRTMEIASAMRMSAKKHCTQNVQYAS